MSSSWATLGLAIGGALLGGWLLAPVLGATLAGGVGFLGGSYLGSMLFPTENEANDIARYEDYPVQSSSVGIPIAIIRGSGRVAGNVIYMSDLVPYQIAHSVAGGGKGGGGEEAKSYETRYRRSFLIAICEGPATITRAWKGNDEILLTSFTSFDGDGNSGISTLIGKDYAEYSNICCAYFEDYELGSSPTVPNFTFEVGAEGEYTKICDLIAGGGVWNTNNIVEMYDASGNYSHLIATESGITKQAVKVLVTSDHSKIIVASYNSATKGRVRAFDEDGNLLWTNDTNIDNIYDLYMDDNGYIYYGALHSSNGLIRKLDPDTGSVIWGGGTGTGAVTGVTESLYFVRDAVGVGRKDDTGAVVWTRAETQVGGRCGLDQDGFLYTRGIVSGESCVWCIPTDSSAFETEVNNVSYVFSGSNGGNTGGVYVLDGVTGGQYSAYIYVGVNTPTGGYVAQLERHGPAANNTPPPDYNDPTLSLVATYDVGATIHDVITDIDGALLVCHNRGTGENGEIGHVTKLSLTMDYLGVLDFDNDRADFVKTIARGSGTPIIGYTTPYDINFAAIIRDLLLDPRIGGYAESDLITEDFKATIGYCADNGLNGSITIAEQRPLPDWIAYICSHFQGYFYEIGGKIGLNCYRNQDSVLSITADDFVREGDEPPVHVTKRRYQATFNRVEATWTNRDNDYKTGVVPAFDRVDQRESGQVRTKTLDLKMITNSELASKMTWRLFIDQLYRFSQYTFKLGYKSMLLEVGDVIDVTDGFFLDAQKMRVLSVDEEENGRSATITAVEDISDFYPSIQYSVQESQRTGDSDITLTDGTLAFREAWDENKLYLSIAPGGAQCNGWYIYRSYDDASYDLVGMSTISGVTGGDANSTGTLQADFDLPAHTAVVHKQKEYFHASIGTVTDLYTSITDDSFFNNRKLAKIGDEIIAYQTCEETSVEGVWKISNLIRGLFGTQPVAHTSGETFSTLDINFVYNVTEDEIGKTLYFKVLSFYADSIQSIGDVSAQSYQVAGWGVRPAPSSLARLSSDENEGGQTEYTGASFTLYWNLPCQKGAGFNQGGFDLNDSYPRWRYGDPESWLVGGNGVSFGNAIADGELQGIDLVFEETDGTLISQRSVSPTAQSAVITKATDLGGYSTAVIKIYPRRTRRAIKAEAIIVVGV